MAGPLHLGRLADLLGTLSLSTDLAAGVPMETSLRTCAVTATLARILGLETSAVSDAYYAALLRHLGCTSFAHEAAGTAAGEDHDFLRTFEAVDPIDRVAVARRTVRALAHGKGFTLEDVRDAHPVDGRVPEHQGVVHDESPADRDLKLLTVLGELQRWITPLVSVLTSSPGRGTLWKPEAHASSSFRAIHAAVGTDHSRSLRRVSATCPAKVTALSMSLDSCAPVIVGTRSTSRP